MSILRSFLFIPGDSEKKLGKGVESGADALILDLEDSVAPSRKPTAREMVAEYLVAHAGKAGPVNWVRINALDEGGLDDLVGVVKAAPAGILVPKTDTVDDLHRLDHYLAALERREGIATPIRIMPVATETARAPFGLAGFATLRMPRLYGVTWGAEDLATALGASTNMEDGGGGQWAFTFRMVRSMCLLAAKAAEVEPVETVSTDFRDPDKLRASCLAAAREGFTGRMAIHPAQVAVINEAFTPSEADVAHAKRVVAAFEENPDAGAVGLDGKMVDIPHLKQARQVLARHEAAVSRG